MEGPDDTSGLNSLLRSGKRTPDDIMCILGKTEGNGCVNDFSRGLATMAHQQTIANHSDLDTGEVAENIMLMMSGGTERVMTPHATVFSRQQNGSASGDEPRLAGGIARTRAFDSTEVGRPVQVSATADAVQAVMADAGITEASNVGYVQIKCPLITSEEIQEAQSEGESVVTTDTYASMGYSRAASALGIAVATGELSADLVDAELINSDPSVYSSVASTSAGVELKHSEVLVLWNTPASASDLVIGNAVMSDGLDADAVRRAITAAGVDPEDPDAAGRIRNVFAKAQATSDGRIRGRRHVINDDSDIPSTRHARSVVNAVVGSVTGDPLSYVSGGAEHQGSDGGGPVAVIADTE
jgi:cyanuric acid amidohydrolase